MPTFTIDSIQIKRSFTPGALPTSLLRGEEFVNVVDGFRLIGDGVTAPAQLPRIAFKPADQLPISQEVKSALDQKASASDLLGVAQDTLTALGGKLDVASDGSITASKATVTGTGTTKTPQQIYGAAFPDMGTVPGGFTDTNVGVRYIGPNTTLGNNVTAIAGYVWNESTTGRLDVNAGNGVALFGAAVGNSDTANIWGVNTLLTDNHTREVASWTQQFLTGAELDFNIMSPYSEVTGVSVGGNSLVQPIKSNAFLANSLGRLSDGTPIRWGTGFGTFAGTASIAFAAGPLNEGANSPSQPLWFVSTDANGNNVITTLRTVSGFAFLEGATSGFKVSQAPLLLDGGEPVIIGGVAVVGDRKTGWTAGTGTPNRGSFAADTTQTISATYTQSQVQALQDNLLALQRRVLALETDLRAHGLIGS